MRKRLVEAGKRTVGIVMAAVMLAGCGSAGTGSTQIDSADTVKEEESKSQTAEADTGEIHRVIIDTDTGADDSAALILAARSENIKIEGVTTLVGNTTLEKSTQNALAALEMAGSDAPVFKGADHTYTGKKIDAFSVFGDDAMGDADLVHPKGSAQKQDAVSFILDTVGENPGEIEIVSLGPATNIANAIKKDPKTMKKVKMIWSLGTTGLGAGNASPVAEFNVYHDAEAYREMLDLGAPVTIIGLDMCDGEAMWTGDQFKELEKDGDIGEFVAKSFAKIREFYEQNGSGDSVMNCDSAAMMCLANPGFVKDSIPVHCSCITDEGETYGQVIFYKKGFTYDVVKNDFDYNVNLITEVDKENYFSNYKLAL